MTTTLFPDLVVNGETVPHARIAAEAQNHAAPGNKPGIAWREAARAMAIRALLLQDARSKDIRAHPRSLGAERFESEEEALIRGLFETELTVKTPSEAAVHSEWARDPSRFRAPPLWEASHILIACDPRDRAGREGARNRAGALARLATDNPADVPRLATEHSDCASKENGGSLGQLGPGDTVPEFEDALRGLAEGAVTPDPVLTRHGYHVIRMDAVAPGAQLPFSAVHQQIAMAMEKAAWARAARDYLADLVAASDISGADLGTGEMTT